MLSEALSMGPRMNALESEILDKLLKRLNLTYIDPGSVTAETPLFDGGLELDSIDMLEIAAMVHKDYGITLVTTERSREVFGTLGALAAFIERSRSRDA